MKNNFLLKFVFLFYALMMVLSSFNGFQLKDLWNNEIITREEAFSVLSNNSEAKKLDSEMIAEMGKYFRDYAASIVVADTSIVSYGERDGEYFVTAYLNNSTENKVLININCDAETYNQILEFKTTSAVMAFRLAQIKIEPRIAELENIDGSVSYINTGNEIKLIGECVKIYQVYNNGEV